MKKPRIKHYKVSYAGRRKTNEDCVFIEIEKKKNNRQMILAAADGMGGYQKGEMASRMMINHLKQLSQEIIPPDREQAANIIKKHIIEANRCIFEKTEKTKTVQMGTTVSGAVVINNLCLFFNVGDSRTYIINPGDVKQITQDHSADAENLKNGAIKESEVGKGHYSHALTRSIGTDPDVDVDIFPPQNFHELEQGEVIFCCTDGFWKKVTKQEISREIFGRKNIARSIEALAALAYSKGSDDNISMAVLEYGTLKRKKEKLKKFVPMSKFGKTVQGEKRKLLPFLLAFLIIVFLTIVVVLIIKLNSNNPPPDNDNQNPKKPPISNDINSQKHPVKNTTDNNHKPEVQSGKIIFEPKRSTHSGDMQVQLIYENLKSSRGDEIPSEIYYTIDGTEPTKNNGKKYITGDKILLRKPGIYIIKARLFSKMGKYKGEVHYKRYIIKVTKPKTITVNRIEELDEMTRDNIFENTKFVRASIDEAEDVIKNGDLKMLICISHKGKATVKNIYGFRVTPSNKLNLVKRNLIRKIESRNFMPPVNRNRTPVNVEILIHFLKIGRLGDKVILSR